MKIEPLISICVPTFNGLPYISKLIDELLVSSRKDFEIVISDDCSTDGTWELLGNRRKQDPRIKCYQNTVNLGMDKNFIQVASLAQGKFIWFCGQDDLISHNGVEQICEYISSGWDIDFYLMNSVKISEDQEKSLYDEKSVKEPYTGYGLEDYMNHFHGQLPTFLPKYIIRRELWLSVDPTRYYGTSYVQVGVFLEKIPKMFWAHVDGCYVVGLTPNRGWQKDMISFYKITTGFFAMLERAELPNEFVQAQIQKGRKSIILVSLLNSRFRIVFDSDVEKDFNSFIMKNIIISLVVKFIRILPRALISVILRLTKARRELKNNTFDGPEFDL